MANRDLLQPFLNADKNRDETFMIEASGFLYNKAAHIIMAMLMNYDQYVVDYPHIALFKDMTTMQIFNATSLFSSLETLNQLSKHRVTLGVSSDEEIEKSISFFSDTMRELEEVDTHKYTILPIFAYSLTQIIKEKCCTKIYITNMQRFSDWEMQYLQMLFKHRLDKVELLVGDPYELYKAYNDELTSIFLNDIYMLHKVNEDLTNGTLNRDIVNKQLFALRVTNDVVKENKDLNMMEYTCLDLLRKYEKNSIHVSMMPLLPISDTDPNIKISAK